MFSGQQVDMSLYMFNVLMISQTSKSLEAHTAMRLTTPFVELHDTVVDIISYRYARSTCMFEMHVQTLCCIHIIFTMYAVVHLEIL